MSSRPPGGVGPKISIEEAAAYLESEASSLEEFRQQRQEAAAEAREQAEEDVRTRRQAARAAATGATAAARRRLAEAARRGETRAREAGSGAGRRAARGVVETVRGDIAADEFVDRRRKSRNQELAERAQRAASIAPITDHSLETLGAASRRPEEMARAGVEMAAADLDRPMGTGVGVGVGVDASVVSPPVNRRASAEAEPDWHDNPDHLDSAAEVRDDLLESGHDPMNVGTPEEALYGHALIHGYADDPGLGGRTPEQLEAEHDMVVAAMDDFGFEHDSPLDVEDVDGSGWGSLL